MNFSGVFSREPRATSSSTSAPSTSFSSVGQKPPAKRLRAFSALDDFDSNKSDGNKKRQRKNSTSTEDLQNIFMDNLLNQRENHTLQNDVLKLQKDKLETKMDIDIETSKIELEKKKIELETARQLAQIEVMKQQRLADLEIKKMEESLEK